MENRVTASYKQVLYFEKLFLVYMNSYSEFCF